MQSILSELRERFPRLTLQVVRVGPRPNARLLEMVGEQTAEARRTGRLLAKKADIDILLRIARTTQIAEAIREVGYKGPGAKTLVALGARAELRRLERYASSSERLRKLVGRKLTPEELDSVEASALLSASASLGGPLELDDAQHLVRSDQ